MHKPVLGASLVAMRCKGCPLEGFILRTNYALRRSCGTPLLTPWSNNVHIVRTRQQSLSLDVHLTPKTLWESNTFVSYVSFLFEDYA